MRQGEGRGVRGTEGREGPGRKQERRNKGQRRTVNRDEERQRNHKGAAEEGGRSGVGRDWAADGSERQREPGQGDRVDEATRQDCRGPAEGPRREEAGRDGGRTETQVEQRESSRRGQDREGTGSAQREDRDRGIGGAPRTGEREAAGRAKPDGPKKGVEG